MSRVFGVAAVVGDQDVRIGLVDERDLREPVGAVPGVSVNQIQNGRSSATVLAMSLSLVAMAGINHAFSRMPSSVVKRTGLIVAQQCGVRGLRGGCRVFREAGDRSAGLEGDEQDERL